MEFKLVEECRRMLSTGKQKIFIKRQVHKGDVEEGSGMICSGEQTVAFVPLVPPDIQTVERITSCLNKIKQEFLVYLVTVLNLNCQMIILFYNTNAQFQIKIIGLIRN